MKCMVNHRPNLRLFAAGLAIAFMLCQCQHLHAQDIDKLKSVIPPSPTAASLGKYAEWPVNLFTGVPQISIPMVTVAGRTVSVPVTLNYHASGIRVSEIPSWVGLGFSLDAGGVITRSIQGLPDDDGGYLLMRRIYSSPGDMSSDPAENAFMPDSTYRLNVAKGLADSEPDSYNFNAMGRTYKFFIGGDGKVVTQPASNLKIKYHFQGGTSPLYVDGTLTSWTVIMEDGTSLEFSVAENLINGMFGSSANGSFQANTAWWLRKITSPLDEVVTFYYEEEEIYQDVTYSESDRIKTSNNQYMSKTGSVYRGRVRSQRLSKIETTLDSAIFLAEDRLDVVGGSALKEVRLYSKLDGTLTRKFILNHDYSVAVPTPNKFADHPEAKYRLKLSGLIERSGDGNFEKKWAFNYHSTKLPNRNSFAQDHWGYYNNAFSNQTFLPPAGPFNPNQHQCADRKPNEAVVAEMLTKISYPTGGYSEFNYEPNSFLTNKPKYKDTTENLTLEHPEHALHIHEAMSVQLHLTAGFINYADFIPALAKIVIKNSSGIAQTSIQISREDLSGNPAGTSIDASYYFITPGDYTVELDVPDTDLLNPGSLVAYVKYDKYKGMEIQPQMTGGLRVKSIFDYDGETSTISKRFFEYSGSFSMGAISDENYLSLTKTRSYNCEVEGGGLTWDEIEYLTRHSSIHGTVFTNGITGYAAVTTLYGENGQNGKSVSYFTTDRDLNETNVSVLPFTPAVDRSWRRGQLLKKLEYTQDGKLLQEERNTYDYVSAKKITAFKSAYKFTILSSCFFYENVWEVLLTGYYDVLSEQVRHLSSTKIQWLRPDGGGLDSIKTVQNFYYDTPANLQATRIETTDSENNVIKTINRTSLDKSLMTGISDWGVVIDSMVNRNIVAPVLQSEMYKGDSLISRFTTKYNRLNMTQYLPVNVKVKFGNGAEETRMNFTSYDVNGNLLEQQRSSDILHAYIYDYYSSVPVAELVNSSVTNSAYTGFESNSTGRWTVASNSRTSGEGFTGNKCYSLGDGQISLGGLTLGTTYLVTIWGKGSATVSVNGTSLSSGLTRNGWKMFQTTISNTTSVQITGTGLVDDVRIHPVNALMTTYTYGPFGMTSQTSPNLSTSFFEYDGLGRLTIVRDQYNQIVKRMTYNYKAQ